MFTHQGSRDNIKLLQRDDAIYLGFARQKCEQIDEQRWTSVVWDSDQIVETVARPVFLEHLFFRDQNNIATLIFAFTNEISALEIGRKTDNVEGAILSLSHFVSLFRGVVMLVWYAAVNNHFHCHYRKTKMIIKSPCPDVSIP